MTQIPPAQLSDHELLSETIRVVGRDRRTTAELVALLAEIESRKLYRGEGYSSLFMYCTQALRLSEPAAYSRITNARVARRFPIILSLLAEGAVTLTTVGRLAGQLTNENHEALLDAARHKSKRDVQRLVAAIDPQPDVISSVRKLPSTSGGRVPVGPLIAEPAPMSSALKMPPASTTQPSAPTRPSVIAPLAPERYLVKFTVSGDTHARLERARNLLRHTIPNGDVAAIFDRALRTLLEELETTKHAAVRRPRRGGRTHSTTRHVPAAVKREVWARDEGRCAFVGRDGRCTEQGFLEFHHVVPFADGGPTNVENLELRCRSHNAYETERHLIYETSPPSDAGASA